MRKNILTGMLLMGISLFTACGTANLENSASSTDTAKSTFEQPTLSVGMLGVDVKTACIIVAKEKGYFDEENVGVTFEKISDLASGITAVSENKLDILPYGSIPSMNFISQGVDLTIFAGTIAEGSEAIVLTENKDSYQSVNDLKGKSIGCFRMETGHMMIKGLCREAGLIPDEDVNFIYLESQAAIMEAVQKGEVDLGFVNSGYGYVCKQSGLDTAFRVGDWKPDFPCCRETTSKETFSNKKDALINFMVAALRAEYDIANNKEEVIRILSKYSGQEELYVENVIYGTEDYVAPMKISLDPDVDNVIQFYEIMKANGDIDSNTPYKVEDHIDDTVYKSALHILIERNEHADYYQKLLY